MRIRATTSNITSYVHQVEFMRERLFEFICTFQRTLRSFGSAFLMPQPNQPKVHISYFNLNSGYFKEHPTFCA
jgi:hypothetical protein